MLYRLDEAGPGLSLLDYLRGMRTLAMLSMEMGNKALGSVHLH